MANDSFKVEVDPTASSVVSSLQILEDTFVDLREFWPIWAHAWLARVQANFDAGGRFSGGWARLKSGRASHLTRSGRLRRSFGWRGGDIGPEGIYEPRANALTIGSSVPHSGAHQSGERHLPARPILWWDDALADQFTSTWETWATARSKAAGLQGVKQ